MADPTPRPRSFTAHRVIRAMTKTCASHAIGLDGFALVSLIAHQWDAIRYHRVVSYRINTLMNLMGLNSKQSFYRIEERCLKQGWLHKKNQGTRMPVLYWVAIPPHAQETIDGPTEDGAPDDGNGTEDGTNPGTNTGPITEPIRDSYAHQSGTANGTHNGTPSTLSLPLTPVPEQHARGLFDQDQPQAPAAGIATPFWLDIYEHDKPQADRERAQYVELLQKYPAARHVGEAMAARTGKRIKFRELVTAVLAETAPAESAAPSRPKRPPTLIEQAKALVTDATWPACLALLDFADRVKARITNAEDLRDELDNEAWAKQLIERSAKQGAA